MPLRVHASRTYLFCPQGALYIVRGEHKRSLMTKRNWEVMNKVWLTIVQAQHSEKPSILRLVDDITDKLHKNIESTEIAIKVRILFVYTLFFSDLLCERQRLRLLFAESVTYVLLSNMGYFFKIVYNVSPCSSSKTDFCKRNE